MTTTKYDGRTGGNICKRPLRQVQSTPYERPPAAARGICQPPPANEAVGSGWFSKLVDPALRVIVRNVSRLFFSVFGKGLATTPGETISRIKEVPEMKSSIEVREQGKDSIDVKLSICYDGSDTSKQELISHIEAIFRFEQLLNQKRFSRAEIDHLEGLPHSRSIGPSPLPLAYYKNKGKISKDSSINSTSSHQVANNEREKGVNVNIGEEDFECPIEIARAYLASKPRKATPSIVGMESKICYGDKAQFGSRLAKAMIASKFASFFPTIPADSLTSSTSQKPRGKFIWHNLARPSNFSVFMKTYRKPFSKSMTTLKRDRDARCFDDTRRVCQKLENLNLSTHPDTSSSFLSHFLKADKKYSNQVSNCLRHQNFLLRNYFSRFS